MNDEIESGKVKWEWIGQAWQLFTANPGTWIGMQLIMVGVIFAIVIPTAIVLGIVGYMLTSMNVDIQIMSIIIAILYVVMYFIIIMASLFMASGIYKTAIKQAQGQAISVKGLFSGKDVFLKFFGFFLIPGTVFIGIGIVTALAGFIAPLLSTIIFIGAFLIMIPAMLLFMSLMYFALPQMAGGKAGVFKAMKVSASITKKHILSYLLLAIATGFMAEIGFLGLGIGILVTMPFAYLIPAVAYCDVFKLKGEGMPSPPPPPDHWMTANQ